MNITAVIAVDDHHLNELQKTLPTWVKYKNFKQFPLLVIYDSTQVKLSDPRFDILKDFKVDYVSFSDPLGVYKTQREKMLTALTALPGYYVKTPWYLKIDTDCTATNSDKWYDESWLEKNYAFITNPWGYTKPANSIELLDKWAASTFKGAYKPLNLPFDPTENKVKHQRIISWLFLCKTEWSRDVTKNIVYRDPAYPDVDIFKLPSISDTEYKVSQDTFLWYMAAIRGDRYKLFNFKDKGFTHGRV
jgi:hypothetical protein